MSTEYGETESGVNCMIQSSAPSSEFFELSNYKEATFFHDIKNLTTAPIFTQDATPTSTTQLPDYTIQ